MINQREPSLLKGPESKDKTFWEKQLWDQNIRWVAGLDEAGRGAWAGPVVAAAVIFDPYTDLPQIDDSKKIPPKKRERLFDLICQKAISFSVCAVSSADIDATNILKANIKAMCEAVRNLKTVPEHLLIDGNRGIGVSIPQRTIIKGDALSMTIGAASILAKVTRDRMMVDLEKKYPQYKFSKHKGYGTVGHQKEIEQFGLIDFHRRSFEPMKTLCAGVLAAPAFVQVT